MIHPSRMRPVRLPDGPRNLRLLLLVGISTVLVTRAILAMLGYPQVGNGSLHIAHALWGGLLMLLAVGATLLLAGNTARVVAALLGGIGLGLFVDEVGKFITQDNDYFFRPAAAVIYLTFAALLLFTARLGPTGPPAAVSDAAVVVANGLTTGLSPAERTAVLRLLADRDDPTAPAVRTLLDHVPTRPGPGRLGRLLESTQASLRTLADRRWTAPTMVSLYVVSQFPIAAVFVAQAVAWFVTGHDSAAGHEPGAVLASAVTRCLEAALAVVGGLRWRHHRRSAIGWLTAAVYLNLFVTQLFNFTDSQFAALAELPYLLAMLALLAHQRRSVML
jgi:hypothetical protein